MEQVTALDIYPADMPEEPDNLDREVFDLNDSLLEDYRHNYYDFVHSRCVGPGIKKSRWRRYIRELARLVKKRGWVQLAEFYPNIQSDNGRLTPEHAIYKWGAAYRHAMGSDRDPHIWGRFGDLLQEAGLRDVRVVNFRVPIGEWHTGKSSANAVMCHG